MGLAIKDSMNTEVTRIHPDKSVKYAAQILKAVDIGCIVVVDGEKVVGICTERDITQKVVAKGMDPEKTAVRDVMTRDVITLDGDRTVDDAVEMMEKNGIKKIPIVEDGRLVGIVTMTDLVRILDKADGHGKA
jgi:CBS domain-containing protein